MAAPTLAAAAGSSQPTDTPAAAPQAEPSPTAESATASPTAAEPVASAPAATQPPASPTATQAPRDCTDLAVFIQDITVPDGTLFNPGDKFTKTWQVQNVGTCTWDDSYRLSFSGGNQMNGAMDNPLPVVRPGETATVSVEMVAPARGGEHFSHWTFRNYAGHEFGLGLPPRFPLSTIINVSFFQAAQSLADAPQLNLENIAGSLPTASPAEEPGSPETPGEVSLEEPVIVATVEGEGVPTPEPDGEPSEEPGAMPTAAPASGGSSAGGCAVQTDYGYVNQILASVNQARAENGLSQLSLNDQLSAAARLHSIDMACNKFVGHNGSDGSTWKDRVQNQGYAAPTSARENIYVGGNAQDAFNWWMNSQVHRDNILFPNVNQIGIGYIYVANSPWGGYYTMIVGR